MNANYVAWTGRREKSQKESNINHKTKAKVVFKADRKNMKVLIN